MGLYIYLNNCNDYLGLHPYGCNLSLLNRRSEMKTYNKNRLFLMCLPAIILICFFVFLPLLRGIQVSLTNWNGFSQGYSYVGFSNYKNLFTDAKIFNAFKNTLYVAIGDTTIQNVLGLTYALLLNRAFRGRNVIRAIIYIPVMVSGLIMGYIWFFIVQYDNGALNDIVMLLGKNPIDWLGDGDRAVNFIMIITSMQFVGQAMIIYLAGLQAVPKALYEAASIDGASSVIKFFHVTLPMLRPAILTTVTLKLIGGLQMYDLVVALTGGGPGFSSHTISTMITYLYFDTQNAGYSAALGVVLFMMIMTATIFVNKVVHKKEV